MAGSVVAEIMPDPSMLTFVPAANRPRSIGRGMRDGVPELFSTISSLSVSTARCTNPAWSPPFALSAPLLIATPGPIGTGSGPPGPSETRPSSVLLAVVIAACVAASSSPTETARVTPP